MNNVIKVKKKARQLYKPSNSKNHEKRLINDFERNNSVAFSLFDTIHSKLGSVAICTHLNSSARFHLKHKTFFYLKKETSTFNTSYFHSRRTFFFKLRGFSCIYIINYIQWPFIQKKKKNYPLSFCHS